MRPLGSTHRPGYRGANSQDLPPGLQDLSDPLTNLAEATESRRQLHSVLDNLWERPEEGILT